MHVQRVLLKPACRPGRRSPATAATRRTHSLRAHRSSSSKRTRSHWLFSGLLGLLWPSFFSCPHAFFFDLLGVLGPFRRSSSASFLLCSRRPLCRRHRAGCPWGWQGCARPRGSPTLGFCCFARRGNPGGQHRHRRDGAMLQALLAWAPRRPPRPPPLETRGRWRWRTPPSAPRAAGRRRRRAAALRATAVGPAARCQAVPPGGSTPQRRRARFRAVAPLPRNPRSPPRRWGWWSVTLK